MWKLLWISAVIVVVDQYTKHLASTYLPGRTLEITSMFNLVLVHNPGAAMGILNDGSGWQRWLLSIVSIGVSGYLIYWLSRLTAQEKRIAVALALIIGGAVGNLIDRLWLGEVVDFIDLHYAGWHFWAFNIADSAITIGAMLVIYDSIWPRHANENQTD
ncbi:MAG: signal peptidase II [Gammaproteobacteria bacterium]|nr:signal peptidase II [Gammaproteobacteria bacterium]MDH5651163.1 signal peptidase II [Gammaproteobacteria bacterium]